MGCCESIIIVYAGWHELGVFYCFVGKILLCSLEYQVQQSLKDLVFPAPGFEQWVILATDYAVSTLRCFSSNADNDES